jgi:hypothetical protein
LLSRGVLISPQVDDKIDLKSGVFSNEQKDNESTTYNTIH